MRADEFDELPSTDATAVTGAGGPWGPIERFTTKQRLAVHREVERLLDDLAPQRPPPRAGVPDVAVKLHRAPGRCVMQTASGAVSASWFPGHGSDETLGELQVIEWRGVVSLPGSARRADVGAVVLGTTLFHPVEARAGEWVWRTAGGAPPLTTDELMEYCRSRLHLAPEGRATERLAG
jgi:hypothetical protein